MVFSCRSNYDDDDDDDDDVLLLVYFCGCLIEFH